MAGHVCRWWHAYTFDNPLRGLVHRPEKILGPYVSPGMTVLDIGCGLGFFSLGLARLVGSAGRVIAVELQPRMLGVLRRRAARAGLLGRIDRRACKRDSVGVADMAGRIDFALAFWVVHEVPDEALFLEQVHHLLKPGAKFLIAEPRGHVSAGEFEQTLALAERAGLRVIDGQRIRFSRAAVLERS